MQKSYFDGGVLSYIAYSILATIISFLTLGLGAPWAAAMLYKWEAEHTVINGRRLRFSGTGGSLFGNWVLWLLLTIITLGIYAFVIPVKLLRWKTEHTDFE